MNITELIITVLLIVIPSGGVLLTAYLFLRKQSEREVLNLQIELKRSRQEAFLPSRMEAYQRAVLLMERIHPGSLVMRLHNPGLPAKQMQANILQSIREEYDHNVSQQLFVSVQGWEMLRNAKEETIKIINIAGNQMSPTSTGTDLAGKIFEIVAEVGKLPTEIVVDYLKKEFQELL